MYVNTEYYREEAKNFKARGYYCGDPQGSVGYKEYWDEQLRRCQEGYSVGGVAITGDHYHYLNFTEMKLTETKRGDNLVKRRTRAKVKAFPDFWDGDVIYYNALLKAEEEGKHMCVGKARRKGFSYKNASKAANTYNTIRDSLSMLCAYDKKYAKALFNKTVASLDFMNEHTAWAKRRQVLNTKDSVKASYLEYFGAQPVEKGYKSIVQAITFKDNAFAGNGEDATLILVEEAGIFANLKETLGELRPCVEDGDVTAGTIVIFGTGGDMDGGSQDFESIFYNPDDYNMMAFENVWDENGAGTFCSFFVPSYMNRVGNMDDQGNSLIEEAKAAEQVIRDVKKKSKDQGSYDRWTRGYPWYPREAFQLTAGNIFPTATLQEQRNRVIREKLDTALGVNGFLAKGAKGVVFRPSPAAKPLNRYPHDKTGDVDGCVVVYQSPYRDENGNVPAGLYYIEHDPYAQDGGSGGSLGSAYVKKAMNMFSKPDDMIVASWVGRPDKQDTYNETLFMLAEYFNAKIGFENDRGEVIPYAKRYNLLKWLKEEPELFDKSSGFKLKTLGRSYGCSMGSQERKGQAEIYLRDWLLTPRGKTEDGLQLLNLHYIYDVALLEELIKYNRKGNFDRVSSLLIGQLFVKASMQKVLQEIANEPDPNNFFNRQHFQ